MPDFDVMEEANVRWTVENDSTQKHIKECRNIRNPVGAGSMNKCVNYPDVITPRDDSLDSSQSSKDQWEMNMEDGTNDFPKELPVEEKYLITGEVEANVDSVCSFKRSPHCGRKEHEQIEYDPAWDLNESRTVNLNSSNLRVNMRLNTQDAAVRFESADTVSSDFQKEIKTLKGKDKPSTDGYRLYSSICRNPKLKNNPSSEYDTCPLSAASNLIHDLDFLRYKDSNVTMSMPAIVPPVDVQKSSSKRISEIEKPLLQNRYLTTIGDLRQNSSVNAGGSSTFHDSYKERRKLCWLCCC